MDQFGGKIDYIHQDGNTYPMLVHGRLAAPRRTSVKVKWVPQEMDLEVLRRELEPFGKVEGISRLRVDGVYKVVTERVNVTMVLAQNKNIPSFLSVDGIKFRVFYPGQPPTCMICASPEHLANNCPSNRKRRWENPAAVQERQQQQQHQQQKQQDQQQHQQQQQQQQQQEQQQQQQNSQQQQQETPAVGQHRPLAISPKSRKNKRKSSRQLTDFEKTEKRDRRNTLTGRESEETSDSDDSKNEDVDGRDSLPHENTDFHSVNLVQGLVSPPADEEAPSWNPASANFDLHLTESSNETSVVEGSQDPFSCPTPKLSITQEEPPRTERRELLDPPPGSITSSVLSAMEYLGRAVMPAASGEAKTWKPKRTAPQTKP